MKNKIILTALFALLLAFVASPTFARNGEFSADALRLLDSRQSDIWIEGARLGDNIVIGSRASLQIIYADGKLVNAIYSDSNVHEWARQMAQYSASEETRGKAFFIAHIETFKPFDFDPQKVFIGEYHLQKGDVLSSRTTNPFGSLDSGSKGFFAFVVPAAELKKGAEISVGYGDDSVLWKVPK